MADVRRSFPKKPTSGKTIPKKPKASALQKVAPSSIATVPDAPAAGLDKAYLKEAQKLDAKIIETINRMGKDVVCLGEAFGEMQDKGFHVALGFPRFEDYLAARWPERGAGKSKVFQAMRIVRELTSGENPTVSKEDVRDMPVTNAEGIAKLKKDGHEITPELIQEAKTMPVERFQREVVEARSPDLAQRAAAERGTTLASAPEVLVTRRITLSSPTEAMRVKWFEIFRWLRKERAADEQPEVSDLTFEDEAWRFCLAEALSTHQAEYEQVMAEREAYTLSNAQAHSSAGVTTEAGGESDGISEADEDGEEESEADQADDAVEGEVLASTDPVGAEAEDVSHTVQTCAGHKANGDRCGSPAIRGGNLCYFHGREAEKEDGSGPEASRY